MFEPSIVLALACNSPFSIPPAFFSIPAAPQSARPRAPSTSSATVKLPPLARHCASPWHPACRPAPKVAPGASCCPLAHCFGPLHRARRRRRCSRSRRRCRLPPPPPPSSPLALSPPPCWPAVGPPASETSFPGDSGPASIASGGAGTTPFTGNAELKRKGAPAAHGGYSRFAPLPPGGSHILPASCLPARLPPLAPFENTGMAAG